ncbi:MAG: ArgE/DapE family deacylase [Actinomycetota bacterium]
MKPTDVESRVLGHLEELLLVDSLVAFIRVPSVTGTDAESDLQHAHAKLLGDAGLDVDTWKFDIAALRADGRFPGEETGRTEGYGVVGMTGPGYPALVLQGHVDVVPTGDLERWHDGDPFSGVIRGDVVHGRGACDMKAGVAANLAVVRTIRASGVTLERPLAIHSVISEEDGGLGAFGTMLRGHGGEAAVLTEPTSNRIVTACAGALTFALAVPGRAAHGSTRLQGMSALDAFLPLNRAIAALEAERNARPDPRFLTTTLSYPISIGRIRAGDWASSVPDLLVAEGRLGVILDEEPADARAAFEYAVAAACDADPWLRDHPATVTWPGGQFASGRIADDHALIDELSDAIRSIRGTPEPERTAAPYGSDLRLYSGLGGIPTLHYGPGDVNFAHAPREQVQLAELFAVARSLTLLALRRCGAHF